MWSSTLLDDLGYVQQSPDEAEVLFTLLAERYERRSVMVTSNLVFSQWDRIFRDQMATAAAIDRPVQREECLAVVVARRGGVGLPESREAARTSVDAMVSRRR